ncbi:MAG TPA: hypothetical protein VJ720_13615 [Chitinophaga sp.]|nr:hypothetical protein [Chitinophaga sp.]
MSDKHLNSGKLPIPMPPADQAWGAMQQRLDAELPVARRSHFHINLWKGISVVATAVTIAGISWWWFSGRSDAGAGRQHTIAVINRDSSINITATTTPVQLPVFSEKGSDTINKTITERTVPFDTALSIPVPTVAATSAEKEPDASDKATGSSIPPAMPLPVPVSKKTKKSRSMVITPSPVTDEQPAHAQKGEVRGGYTGNHYEGQEKNNDEKLLLERITQPLAGYNTRLENKVGPVVLPFPEKTTKAAKPWSLYAQLPVQIPLSGGSNYIMGPNGKSQFYRTLIPSVRLERKLEKSALSLDVIPSLNSLFRENKYKTGRDTIWPVNDTVTSLLKQFGCGLSLQYHTPVYKNWRLSAGIQATFLRKAVMQRSVTDTMTVTRTTIYAATTEDWKDLSRFRLNGVMELYYEAGEWQMGIRTLIPVSSAGKNIKTPVQLELLFRRRLWQYGKR